MSQQAAPGKPRGSVRLQLASLGILSGLLAGILMGIAARIAMRIVALVVDQGLEFTVAGTLGIIMVVSFSSVLLGLIFVTVKKVSARCWTSQGPVFQRTRLPFHRDSLLIGPVRPA